jgi:hypothetical protein
MGHLLVEILEAGKPGRASIPSLTSVTKEIPMGMAILDRNFTLVQTNPALERMVN